MYLQNVSAIRKWRLGIVVCVCIFFVNPLVIAQIQPNDVLILVNQQSYTSKYIARLYRQYYPDIPQSQVLYLSGLTDCASTNATPESEIISRSDYNNLIAQPVKDFLTTSGLTTEIKVIITTAGMPYRIDDSDPLYDNAIYANGSDPMIVANNRSRLDIASVESELTALWYPNTSDTPFVNRMVNPYQGYRQSPIDLFERHQPGTKTLNWTRTKGGSCDPIIEGFNEYGWPIVYGAKERSFNAGDIYLVSRLDGPKTTTGRTDLEAVHSVRAMLERAKRVSDKNYYFFTGLDPQQAVAVIDDAPGASNYDWNRIYNLDSSVNYLVYDVAQNQPPDAVNILNRDDYSESYTALTNSTSTDSVLNTADAACAYDCLVMHDRRISHRTSQADIDSYAATNPERVDDQGIILLATFGYNGDEGSTEHYMLEDGPQGEILFNCLNGAIFTSIESLNAVTMFSDVSTLPAPHHQGKIVDFIQMGGTAAIGHVFEPVADSIVDNMYLHYNLLADNDSDGLADLTFIEAAYTAIPYLSWAEIVIGDPLMRISYTDKNDNPAPGGKVWTRLAGDANNDGRVNSADIWTIKLNFGGVFKTSNQSLFDRYNDLCDINNDYRVNSADIWATKANFGAIADWR